MTKPGGLEAIRHFKPSGPVSASFIADQTSTVKALLGPVGGGKSVACVFDSVRRPSFMPACNDGIIRYRRAIIGSTYGQMERNLYPTWKRWLPEDGGDFTPVADWKGGGGRSAVHKLSWAVVRGAAIVEVRAEYVFAAVGEMAVEEFMRGFEVSDIWPYEMDQLPEAVIDVGITRLGRYPANGDAPDALSQDAQWTPQIAGDLNAPDIDSWFFQKFEEDPPNGFKVYKQPSGRSPRAENIKNLPRGYYDRQIDALSKRPGGKHLITRMVDAKYAPSRAGQPVYEEYDDDTHLAPEELKPAPRVPIVLGFDQGLAGPACVGFQPMPNGQRRVLFEVVPGRMSERRFAELVKFELDEVAPGHPLAETHWCDPAGFDGADKEDGQMAWAEIVANELSINIQPTETNAIPVRLKSVTDYLGSFAGPGQPSFVLSRRCRVLRKGFVSHYMYERRPDEKTQQKRPVKGTSWSDIHDALQYGFLGLTGRAGVVMGTRDENGKPSRIGQRGERQTSGDCVVMQAPVEF